MLTIALAQFKGELFNKQENLNRICKSLQACKERNADYIIFPELFLSGFFIKEKIQSLAETSSGDSIALLQKEAKAAGVGIIIGFPERKNNCFYNSAAFIEKNGMLKGIYRKIHLFDDEEQFFTSGTDFPIFQTSAGKVGIMMTFDMEFPEVARIYALKGVKLIVALNAHTVPYEPHQELFLRSRALENQFFIAAANRVGLEKNALFFGESAIISPEGHVLAKGGNNDELIFSTIDIADTDKIRADQPMKYLKNRKSKLYKKNGL